VFVTFEIDGRIPAKKNRWRNYGRLPAQDKEAITALEWQIAATWRHRIPASPNAVLIFELVATRSTADRDNIYTTLLDSFVKCRVLTDDSSKHANGLHILKPLSVSPKPRSRIHLFDGSLTDDEAVAMFRLCGLPLGEEIARAARTSTRSKE
jgi:hypothetical protein